MKLSQFTANRAETATLHVEDPVSGEPLYNDPEAKEHPVRITLLGIDSDKYKSVQRRLTDQKLARQLKQGRKFRLNAADLETDQLELLVACTVKWEGLTDDSGQALECLPVNVRAFYAGCDWLREQVSAFVNDRANFLGNS